MRRSLIAVTGAGGFVGSALVRHLRDAGVPVIAMQRSDTAWVAADEARADFTRGEHMNALVEQGFRADVIVHLAGRVQVSLRPDAASPTENRPGQSKTESLYLANVVGVANAVDLARACGARKIVFASSQTVYGWGESGEATESTPLRPLEHYAASKVCAEQLLATAAKAGLSVTILRFPGIFSPRRLSGAVHAMCRDAISSRRIVLRPECPIPFDVLALDDLLPAIAAAIRHEGSLFEVFNVSTGRACSLELLAEWIAGQVPGAVVEQHGVPQPRFRMDATKAERVLKWRSAETSQRLAEMVFALQK